MKKIYFIIILFIMTISFSGCGSHVHEYIETIVEPTCVEQGYTTYTCSCGDSYKDNEVDALGHTYGEWKVVKKATLIDEGLKERVCEICNEKETKKINTIKELKLNENIKIDKQVIFEKEGIKIIANSIEYYNQRVILKLDFENNTNKEISIICGSWGYSVNSINGWYMYDGYLNLDLEPNEIKSEELDFYYFSLYQYGITEIAYIEVGFEISNYDDYEDTVYTGPLKIKTNLYNDYDFTQNTYQDIINNGVFEYTFNCDIITSDFNKIYNEENVTIESSICMHNNNSDALILEFKNDKEEEIKVILQNVYINNLCMYENLWDYISLPSNTRNLLIIEFEELIDNYDGNKEDLLYVKTITFNIGYSVDGKNIIGNKTLKFELPNIKVAIE